MSAAPTPMIRQPGLGTSSPPANPFLSGIQENLARRPPTALSSQFNTHPVSLVPNFPPPTTFSNFAASTPHNKHPTKKKVILPKSNQSSSSETSYHKSTNKKGKGNKSKKGKSITSPIYESLNSSSESSQRQTIVFNSSPAILLPSVTTSAPAPASVSVPTRPPLLMATGEPMDPDLATFIAAAVQTMNVGPSCGSSQQLQEHADIHSALLVEMYETLKNKGKALNAKLDEENRKQNEDDQQLNMTVGEYDEMGTHSQEEPTQQGPVTRCKSVAHDTDDIFNPERWKLAYLINHI